MTTVAHDGTPLASGSRLATGLGFALVSAASFGMSGGLARELLDVGWSAGAIVLVRVGLAALVVLPMGVVALRGRWEAVRRSAGLILMYGIVPVAGTQFCYFSAVQHMQVGPALLIEYTAPAAVVVWMWLRRGERPGPITLVGAGLAALGLVFVLDLLSGADLSLTGVLWALAAMLGAAAYFVMSADEANGLPPITLVAGGLVVGAVVLGALGLLGLLPMRASTESVTYAGRGVDWWIPLVVLAVVTAAIAYTTGVLSIRRLGSRLASFVALLEVVAAVLFAWLLLDELPRSTQLVGGLLILTGVVVVKLGERETISTDPGV